MSKKPFLVEYYHTVSAFETDQNTTQYFAVVLAENEEEAEEQLESYKDNSICYGFTSGFKAIPFTENMVLSSVACQTTIQDDFPNM